MFYINFGQYLAFLSYDSEIPKCLYQGNTVLLLQYQLNEGRLIQVNCAHAETHF